MLIEMLELLYYNSDADTTKPIHQIIEALLNTQPKNVTKPIMTSEKKTVEREQIGVRSENVFHENIVVTSQNTMTSSTDAVNNGRATTRSIMTSQRNATDVLYFVVVVGMTVFILGSAMFVFWKKMLDSF